MDPRGSNDDEHPPAPVPRPLSARSLRQAAERCRACELWAPATQVVVGEGPSPAETMLVGEQPGDREDLEGHPFVGPAGRMLDRALERAGMPRAEVYLTNAVKHFRFSERGKRRIHEPPSQRHVTACSPWFTPSSSSCVRARSSASAPPRRGRCSAEA